MADFPTVRRTRRGGGGDVKPTYQKALDALFEAAGDGGALDCDRVAAILGIPVKDRAAWQALVMKPPSLMLVEKVQWQEHQPTVAGYCIHHKLGSGGLADVYLGEDEGPVKRPVALKIPRFSSPTARADFERERQITASLNHEGICHYYATGLTQDGRPFVAMEYVEGLPIDKFVQAHCDRKAMLTLFMRVLEAVAFAHGKGVVHCDLKPNNLLVKTEAANRVKVIDFGLGKFLRGRQVDQILFGTQGYTAPEVLAGEVTVDVRRDVYALGKVLQRLVAVCREAKAERGNRLYRQRRRRGLTAVIAQATQADPRQRYPTVEHFRRDVAALMVDLLPSSDRESFTQRIFYSALRQKTRSSLLLTAMLFIVVMCAYSEIAQRRYTQVLARERDLALAAEQQARAHQAFLVSLFTEKRDHRPVGNLAVAEFVSNAHHLLNDKNLSAANQQDLLGSLVKINLAVGNYSSAIEAADTILAKKDDWSAHVSRIDALFRVGRLAEADTALKKGLPNAREAATREQRDKMRYLRALLSSTQNCYEEAIKELNGLESPTIGSLEPRLHLAWLYIRTNRGNEAFDILNQIAQVAKEVGRSDTLLVSHAHLSDHYKSYGCADAALSHLDEALALQHQTFDGPHYTEIMLYLGRAHILIDERRFDEAAATLEQVDHRAMQLPSNPELEFYRHALGFYLAFERGDYSLATNYAAALQPQKRGWSRQQNALYHIAQANLAQIRGETAAISADDYTTHVEALGGWQTWHDTRYHLPLLLVLYAQEQRADDFDKLDQFMADRLAHTFEGQTYLARYQLRRAEALRLLGRSHQAVHAETRAAALLDDEALSSMRLFAAKAHWPSHRGQTCR